MSELIVLLFAAMMSVIAFIAGVRKGFKVGYKQGLMRGVEAAVVTYVMEQEEVKP